MKLTRWSTLLFGVLATLNGLRAQSVSADDFEIEQDRAPSIKTGGNVMIRGATLLTVTDGVKENSSILIEGGIITRIGRDFEAPEGVTVIDGDELFVMPGIIDCHSHIAIEGGVNESTQSVVAEVRIDDEVNHRDLSIYRALAGGTTIASLLHGSANVIGGQNAVIKFRYGKTAAELLMSEAPRGIKFALGENVKRSNSRSRNERFPNTRMGVEAVLRRAFVEAQAYRQEWADYQQKVAAGEDELEPRRDLRLQTLVEILEGKILVHSHCYRSDEILMLLRVAEEFGFKIRTLQHVLEGYKIAAEIAAHGAGPSTFADWWAYKIEAYDAIPHNAAVMLRAGARTSVNSDSSDLIRRLYHEAAKSLRYGNLSATECLELITIHPAWQLGIDEHVGSLEVGKHGDLAVFNGHPLSVYSRCELTFIDGECYFERRFPRQNNATSSQFEPRPMPKPSELPVPQGAVIAIRDATLVPVSSPKLEHATLVIADGKIQALGKDVAIPPSAAVIDGSGLFVYPGLFDAATSLGLGEIGSVPGTNDTRELGRHQADLRVTAAYHPNSRLIPVTRSDGITHVQVLPDGQGITGQSAIMHLAGETWEETALVNRAALTIRFPKVADDEEPAKALTSDDVQALLDVFGRAKRYGTAQQARSEANRLVHRDLTLEALAPYAEGRGLVLLLAESRNQIRTAVLFAEQLELQFALLGVSDGWLVADFLAEHQVPCLVGPVLARPKRSWERYDAAYQNPARLHAAGVPIAIVSQQQENVRHLGHHAGMAAAYGLPREEALAAVTLRPAQILGVADHVGSLEPGKIANVIVTDGDPLELRTHVHYAFIAGRAVPVTNAQTELYERYLERLAQQQTAAEK